MNEFLEDHTPRFLPGTYSVNAANNTTNNAPNPNPWIKRNTYNTVTLGAAAPPIIAMMWITSYNKMDFLRPILSPIGPPTNAPNN